MQKLLEEHLKSSNLHLIYLFRNLYNSNIMYEKCKQANVPFLYLIRVHMHLTPRSVVRMPMSEQDGMVT